MGPSGTSVTLDDTVLTNIREATTSRTATSLGSSPRNQQAVSRASRPADCTPELPNTASTMEEQAREHRRLFRSRRSMHTREHNFEPPKASLLTTVTQTSRNPYKGKGKRRIIRGARQPARVTWKKSCVCLKNVSQKRKPSAVEKMDLAKMGLGLAELKFDYDGDAEHIHSVLMNQFPQLENCGGYTLLRLNDNSHDLVEIDYPAKGMTVPYLKDILNQAKLYIRPLQKNITADMHQVMSITIYSFAIQLLQYVAAYLRNYKHA